MFQSQVSADLPTQISVTGSFFASSCRKMRRRVPVCLGAMKQMQGRAPEGGRQLWRSQEASGHRPEPRTKSSEERTSLPRG
jgi:hypothetical protein